MHFERTDNFRRRVCGHEHKSVEIENATTNLAEREPGVTTWPVRTAIVIRHVWLRPISLCLFVQLAPKMRSPASLLSTRFHPRLADS